MSCCLNLLCPESTEIDMMPELRPLATTEVVVMTTPPLASDDSRSQCHNTGNFAADLINLKIETEPNRCCQHVPIQFHSMTACKLTYAALHLDSQQILASRSAVVHSKHGNSQYTSISELDKLVGVGPILASSTRTTQESPPCIHNSHLSGCIIRSRDSRIHGANMGPIWGLQGPGGPHVGPMNLAIWALWSFHNRPEPSRFWHTMAYFRGVWVCQRLTTHCSFQWQSCFIVSDSLNSKTIWNLVVVMPTLS